MVSGNVNPISQNSKGDECMKVIKKSKKMSWGMVKPVKIKRVSLALIT